MGRNVIHNIHGSQLCVEVVAAHLGLQGTIVLTGKYKLSVG